MGTRVANYVKNSSRRGLEVVVVWSVFVHVALTCLMLPMYHFP